MYIYLFIIVAMITDHRPSPARHEARRKFYAGSQALVSDERVVTDTATVPACLTTTD